AEPFDYSISYENVGTGDATLVEVIDTLPDYVTFKSATPAPTSISGSIITWLIGDVQSGGTGSITVSVKTNLVVPDGEELINTATLYYADANGNMLPPESDTVITTVDAGSIGDFVWHDYDMDGIYDSGEMGVGGVTVNLLGSTPWGDVISSSTTTDGNGNYLFEGLPPGDYEVSIELPWGWGPTTPNPVYVTLTVGQNYLDVDFGIAEAEIEKTVAPDVAKIGNILHVTLWVKNPFPLAYVVDTLPPELEYTGNALDDDGDGLIDEEKEDGLDNDGDSLVDEDLGNFMVNGAYITGGLTLNGNQVIYGPIGRGIHTVEFDIIVVVDPEGEIYVTNLAELVVDDEVIVYDTYEILIRYSGFDKYFVPINNPPNPPEPGEIVVDGNTPGYFFDYGDGDGIIEVGELIFWLVEYNITNNLNYTWTSTRMEDRWGGEYGVGGDGADNDNDGLIDEEAFNMLDDDGDGKIDEDIDVYYISQGSVTIELRGKPPNSDKVYIYWWVGELAPGESAIMRLPVFTDRNPGDNQQFPQGHQCFSSPGFYIMNSGGVVKWDDDRGKQHSAHTLRLYCEAIDDGGDTATGTYAPPPSIISYSAALGDDMYDDEGNSLSVEIENPAGLPLSAKWSVDNEEVAEGFEYEFTPSAPGTYSVEVRMAGEYHLSGKSLLTVVAATHSWNIQVTQRPDLPPSAVITSPEDESTFMEFADIIFDGGSSFDLESQVDFYWDFGDGHTSDIPLISHAYEDAGDYTVTLTVCDSVGQSDAASVIVHILAKGPFAVIESPTDTTFHEGENIPFAASASYLGDESALTYEWNLDDGTVLSGSNANHAYSDDGVYTVILTVRDIDGREDKVVMEITIQNQAPSASMNAPYQGEVGEPIQFKAKVSDAGDDVLTIHWDFGDGNTALGTQVTYTYLNPGNYDVTLTVSDEDNGVTIVLGTAMISEITQQESPSETAPDEQDIPEETSDDESTDEGTDIPQKDSTDNTKKEIEKASEESGIEEVQEINAAEGTESEGTIPPEEPPSSEMESEPDTEVEDTKPQVIPQEEKKKKANSSYWPQLVAMLAILSALGVGIIFYKRMNLKKGR
ncbi:MAG: PKD domain-containing protein, partial [Thermoplasmata archaeon]